MIIKMTRKRFVECCNKKGVGYLYLIECYNDEEKFYKIGITSNREMSRFYNIPYKFNIINIYECKNAEFIYDVESMILKTIKDNNLSYTPKINFLGITECASDYLLIEKKLKEISNWYKDFIVHKYKLAGFGAKLYKKYSFTKLAKQYCQLMSELDNCSDIVLRKELIENINNIINCSENLQKYHGVLNHTNITSSAYNMKKLDEMYNSKVILQCLGSNPLKLENNKIYEVSFIKKKLLEIYIDNGINKTPNTKDLKFWYDVSVTTLKNVNNIIVSGFRITNIK